MSKFQEWNKHPVVVGLTMAFIAGLFTFFWFDKQIHALGYTQER